MKQKIEFANGSHITFSPPEDLMEMNGGAYSVLMDIDDAFETTTLPLTNAQIFQLCMALLAWHTPPNPDLDDTGKSFTPIDPEQIGPH